jgi:hypothetical protein
MNFKSTTVSMSTVDENAGDIDEYSGGNATPLLVSSGNDYQAKQDFGDCS